MRSDEIYFRLIVYRDWAGRDCVDNGGRNNGVGLMARFILVESATGNSKAYRVPQTPVFATKDEALAFKAENANWVRYTAYPRKI